MANLSYSQWQKTVAGIYVKANYGNNAAAARKAKSNAYSAFCEEENKCHCNNKNENCENQAVTCNTANNFTTALSKQIETKEHSIDGETSDHDDSESSNESSDEERTCSNCSAEDVDVEFCYSCKCDYCDECGIDGECGVCGSETNALEEYAQAIQKIRGMTALNETSKTSLHKLVCFMELWQQQVEASEEQILCMTYFGGGKHDANDIMTDCGDTVRDEMNWCLKRAETICRGESTFDVEA